MADWGCADGGSHGGRMGEGLGWLPGLPFDLDLELHKGGLSSHRKHRGRQGENVTERAQTACERWWLETDFRDRMKRHKDRPRGVLCWVSKLWDCRASRPLRSRLVQTCLLEIAQG